MGEGVGGGGRGDGGEQLLPILFGDWGFSRVGVGWGRGWGVAVGVTVVNSYFQSFFFL